MKIRVLGCHGGELPGYRTTCFLIDGKLSVTLKGDGIVQEFLKILDDYVARTYGESRTAALT